jgi:hypothetical protein
MQDAQDALLLRDLQDWQQSSSSSSAASSPLLSQNWFHMVGARDWKAILLCMYSQHHASGILAEIKLHVLQQQQQRQRPQQQHSTPTSSISPATAPLPYATLLQILLGYQYQARRAAVQPIALAFRKYDVAPRNGILTQEKLAAVARHCVPSISQHQIDSIARSYFRSQHGKSSSNNNNNSTDGDTTSPAAAGGRSLVLRAGEKRLFTCSDCIHMLLPVLTAK